MEEERTWWGWERDREQEHAQLSIPVLYLSQESCRACRGTHATTSENVRNATEKKKRCMPREPEKKQVRGRRDLLHQLVQGVEFLNVHLCQGRLTAELVHLVVAGEGKEGGEMQRAPSHTHTHTHKRNQTRRHTRKRNAALVASKKAQATPEPQEARETQATTQDTQERTQETRRHKHGREEKQARRKKHRGK